MVTLWFIKNRSIEGIDDRTVTVLRPRTLQQRLISCFMTKSASSAGGTGADSYFFKSKH